MCMGHVVGYDPCMSDTFIIAASIWLASVVVAIPLSRISEHLQAIAKAHYNSDGSIR